MRFIASDSGVDPDVLDHAHDVFDQAKRIDINKIGDAKEPGFMIILDQKLSLWFYKSGDHYRYDGFEMGPYGPDVDPKENEG